MEKTRESNFIDFVLSFLEYDASIRTNPMQALSHPFLVNQISFLHLPNSEKKKKRIIFLLS